VTVTEGFAILIKVTFWTVVARLRSMVRRSFGAFGWLRSGHISIVIVVAVLGAAAYTLPLSPGPGSSAPPWRVPQGGPQLIEGTVIPVFCVKPPGPTLRCGIAEGHADGKIGFLPYGRPADTAGTIAVLSASDISLLWALADPAGRTQVQALAADVVRQMVVSLHDVTASETWRHEYREALGTLLDRAARQAWRAEDTTLAFRAFIRASEPVIRDSVANDVGPAIAPYVAGAFWRVVKTTSSQMLSIITGKPLDLTSIGASFVAATQDPDVQAAVGRLGPRLLDLPQTEVLFERMAANMADALQRDPQTMELMTRAVVDPRLGDELRQVRSDVGVFIHELGKVLWGLGDSRSMNPLAGLSVKTALVGESQPLILLLDPDDAASLVRTVPGRATLLVPEVIQ
jgi:hypothetical protein